MKRVQTIHDLEFEIEATSECLIEVSHRDQVGWFGINLGDDTDEKPFAWTVDADKKTEDGILGVNPKASPELALEELAACMAEAQEATDLEVAQDPRNQLGALLSTMPTENKGGWRRLSGVSNLAKRGSRAVQEKASQTGGRLKDGTGTFLEKAGQKASQGKEKLQDGVAKANLAEKRQSLAEAFSPSKQCEREGHIFDQIKLISTKGTLSRMCRRCHKMILVNLDEEGLEGIATIEDKPTEETNPDGSATPTVRVGAPHRTVEKD